MKQHKFLQILQDCGSEPTLPILSEKSGDRPAQFHLPNHSHSHIYSIAKVSVNSTSAWPGDGTLLPTCLGGKFGELDGTFA